MNSAGNVNSNPSANGVQNAAILPEKFDATTLKDFFEGLIKNAPPGDRDALKAITDDLQALAERSEPGLISAFVKLPTSDWFSASGHQINNNLVPFLEAIANNPGGFGKDIEAGQSLDQTIDAIVENAPSHLKSLLSEVGEDIKGMRGLGGDTGEKIASLMTYLVNKGNANTAANEPGSAIGDASGASPNGASPDNMVPDTGNPEAATADVVARAADAMSLVTRMMGNPAERTADNLRQLTQLMADVVTGVAERNAGGRPPADVSEAGTGDAADTSVLGKVQDYLSDILGSLLRQLDRDGNKRVGSEKGAGNKAGGAAGGEAGGAMDATGGAAVGEAAGESEGAGEVAEAGGSEATGGTGGLSVFEVIAKALGDKMTTKLKEMKALAEEISSLTSDGAGSEEIAGQSAKLSAASQEFSLLSNTFSTTIKALGEGTKAAVRYS